MRILVVEDDAFLSQAYKMKLEKEQFEVVVLHDGTQVLSTLQSFAADAIILDLIMPGKDGFAVLEELASSTFSHIPVLVASNLGQEQDIEKAKTMGAKDYIIKSDFSLSDIVQKVRSLVPSPQA